MPLVVAACSNRKRPSPDVRAAGLQSGVLEDVGKEWLALVENLPRQSANELYCGRSVRDAERAARTLHADILFASAGLGWIRSTEAVPSYGMTVVAGDDSVMARIENSSSPAEWWGWLNSHSPFATSLLGAIAATDGLVLVALPGAYLAMVEADLLALPEALRQRLRIIQRGSAIREMLRPWTLIYDDRLEAGSAHSGTRSDFSARAACHFVEQILPGIEGADVCTHNEAVEAALSAWTAPLVRLGARRSDEELRDIIALHWDAAGGKTTRLLRILRDDLGIACEQGRFARLVGAIRAEREAAR